MPLGIVIRLNTFALGTAMVGDTLPRTELADFHYNRRLVYNNCRMSWLSQVRFPGKGKEEEVSVA